MADAKTESTSASTPSMSESKSSKAAKEEYPDTPSGKALAAVGNVNGEDLEDPHEGLAHGEKYQAEKAKHRWGTSE
jgi:hypothetical protein